jgi:putative endonuclease
MNDLSRRAFGRWGEDRAVRHFRREGYLIVDRNWRSPEREVGGELDVVAVRGGVVVFCEVKARRTEGYGGAAAAVDVVKQERIRALASSWLRIHGQRDHDVRFDVIAVEGVALTHHEAAF